MSNHRSQRDINLHHDQVNAGRARRASYRLARQQHFQENRLIIKHHIQVENIADTWYRLLIMVGVALITSAGTHYVFAVL